MKDANTSPQKMLDFNVILYLRETRWLLVKCTFFLKHNSETGKRYNFPRLLRQEGTRCKRVVNFTPLPL